MSSTATCELSIPSLEPVEALRGEQDQLESWVHQSFSALERLHTELNDWQQELTKQQAALDESQSLLAKSQTSLAKSEANEQNYSEQIGELKQGLGQCRDELAQLEEESTVQSQDNDELERQHAADQAELKTVREFADQMAATQETQQELSAKQQRKWNSELKEMRQLLERQYELLNEKLVISAEDSPAKVEKSALPSHSTDSTVVNCERNDEIRRRAKSRRAAINRKSSHSE